MKQTHGHDGLEVLNEESVLSEKKGLYEEKVPSEEPTLSEEKVLITVLNMDGKKLTPCLPHRAQREVDRSRAVWLDEGTIKLLYNPFLFQGYRKTALKRDRHICLWCGRPATTVDHIIPSSKGGSDLPHNLLASCSECNTRRGNRAALSYFKDNRHFVPKPFKLNWRIFKATFIEYIRKCLKTR